MLKLSAVLSLKVAVLNEHAGCRILCRHNVNTRPRRSWDCLQRRQKSRCQHCNALICSATGASLFHLQAKRKIIPGFTRDSQGTGWTMVGAFVTACQRLVRGDQVYVCLLTVQLTFC